MGHIMDRSDKLGRELGLCTAADHRDKGCTVASSADLDERLTDALAEIMAIGRLAEDAATAWDRTRDYTDHGDAVERVRLELISRAARILTDPTTIA